MDIIKQATENTADQQSIRSGSDCNQGRNVDHHLWMPRTSNTNLQGGIKAAKQITPILPKYVRTNPSPQIPQSKLFRTPPTPKTTPKYRPRSHCRRNLSQQFTTPVSPLLKNPPPIMSSTVYTPVKNPPTHLPWGENIYCYHCGGTVNLLQSSRVMEHLSKLTIKDIGRTVFDLEKLSDTGMASKCIYSLENSDNDMLCDGDNFLEDILKPNTSKSLETCPPIANRDKQDTTAKTNEKKPTKLIENWEDTLYSITADSFNDPWPPLSSLDVLDVEEMLKLLDTSLDDATAQPDVPSVESDKEKTSLDGGTANTPQPDVPSNTSVESDKEKSPSPIPKRQLRPRKKL